MGEFTATQLFSKEGMDSWILTAGWLGQEDVYHTHEAAATPWGNHEQISCPLV